MNRIGVVNRLRLNLLWGIGDLATGLRHAHMKPDVQAKLGRRVSAIRTARGYTQEELADRCGFTMKFISSIERGLVNVPLVSLASIAKGLGVTISELTLAVDGAVPREVRTLEQLFAGRGPKEQQAVARVLAAMEDLLAVAKQTDDT